MKTKEIEVSIDTTINLGNFENIRPSITLKADLEEGDDLDECSKQLYGLATASWSKEAIRKIRLYRSFRKDKDEFDRITRPILAELKKHI